jgi:microcompartment protein CcmL/EutN
MSRTAIGMVETVGLLAAYEAADVAVKSANVKLIGYEISRGGMVVIKFSGDIGAVKSAVDAAAAAASRLGEVFSSDVIPRPHQDIDKKMIFTDDTVGYKKDKAPEESADKTSEESQEESQEIVEVKESKEETEEVDIEDQPEEEFDIDEQGEETEVDTQVTEEESKKESEEDLDEAEDEIQDSEEEFDSEEEEEESEYDDEPKKEVEEELDETEYFDEDEEDAEDEEDEDDEDDEDICNLCGDPACPRRKGELRTDCIHYDEIMGDDE